MKRKALGLALAVVAGTVAIVGLVPSVRSALLSNVFDRTATPSQPTELGLVSEDTGELKVGDPAPNFRLKTVDGDVIELADYEGDRRVILNFWATWCPPCKAEMPDFEAAYQTHGDELVVLGVDLMESRDVVEKFLRDEVDVSYPILIDSSGEVARGYRLFTQPTTYFIDRQGRIASVGGQPSKNGAFTPEELDQRVESFLDDASTTEANSDAASSSTSSDGSAFRIGDLAGKYFTERQAADMGFDVDPTRVRYADWVQPDRLMSGGPAPDGIPSIDAPEFQSIQSASQWLQPNDVVLGIERHGEAKAYPIRVLNWHEIVNDTIGGTPIAATYCPLCGSGVVFVRPELDGARAEFGTSGRLYNSDLVMYDRVTGTFWSQIDGSPMVGPLVGEFEELERLPSSMARWAGWKRTHPDGRVLARPTTATAMGGDPPRTDDPDEARRVRDYRRNPYSGYADRERLMFPVATDDDRLGNKRLVSGVTRQGRSKAYLKSAVQRVGVLNDFVGGAPVLVTWHSQLGDVVVFHRKTQEHPQPLEFKIDDGRLVDTTTGTTWNWSGQAQSGPLADSGVALERVHSMTTFWFAWAAFHPETELFNPTPASSSAPENTQAAETQTDTSSPDGDVKVGDLGWKYLTEHLAQERGLDIDVENVRYASWLNLRRLRSGGQPPDGIPSIDAPRFESVQSASGWLKADDLVLTVEHNDQVKAYPTRILNYHEIVNDTIGRLAIAATYCPLCHSGVVFRRPELRGERTAFGVSGKLYNSNLVMYDRATGTFWDQITGRPMVGPLVGKADALDRVPSDLARWGVWKARHPEAQVLSRPTSADPIGGYPPMVDNADDARFLRDYSTHPYADYASSDHGTFGTLASDHRLVPKERITGVVVRGQAKAYRKSAVADHRIVNDTLGGTAIAVAWNPETDGVIVFRRDVPQRTSPLTFDLRDGRLRDRETGTVWSWNGRAESGPLAGSDAQLERVTSMPAYWFAWAAFHSGTELYAPVSRSESGDASD